jgi:hypothetical protein
MDFPAINRQCFDFHIRRTGNWSKLEYGGRVEWVRSVQLPQRREGRRKTRKTAKDGRKTAKDGQFNNTEDVK